MAFVATIDRKLLREVARLKGQVATIALVLASGITCFIALRGTYDSLLWSRDAYYDRYRFADVFAHAERAPEATARRIEAIPGVAVVETRISEEVSVPLEGMERAAYARLLSTPAHRESLTNALYLRSGRMPERGHDDEVVILDAFASAHGLQPGHRLPVVVGGALRQLQVVGIALSPEFVYAIRPGAMADDPARYAVLWMDRVALASPFKLDGAFNDVTIRLQPGASAPSVLAAVDRILAPYGGDGAIARSNQISNHILTGELGQLAALAGMVPLVFLGVAAFLINMVLARLVALQRGEIATLKAVGYSNREVATHYLGLVAVVMVPGALLGVVGGLGLGRLVLDLYRGIFRFPDLSFRMSVSLVVAALLSSTLAAVVGALFAVRSAAKMPPAEAMRPPAPAHYRRGLFERLGLAALAGTAGMMVLREIERRPLRTLLSATGIAGAVALIILGHFGMDSLDNYLEATFRREQRQNLALTFVHPEPPRVVETLARLPGVLSAEGIRAVPVRIRHRHRARDSVFMGLPDHGSLRRLVGRGGQVVDVPADGVVLTKTLAEVLELHVGDRPDIELREGERALVHPVVTGLVDESVGLQVYARAPLLSKLEGDMGAVSSVLLSVDPRAMHAVEERLRRAPDVIDVSDVSADVERLRDMNGAAMDVWTIVSITLSAAVVFGVVYNNARIALAMRSRDLASLRVLGFSRSEISAILIGGLAVEVAIAIPIGFVLGRAWAELFFTRGVDRETFRFQVLVEGRTYLLAAAVAALAAAASALWVRRSLDRLDLIEVLKTRE